MNLIFIQKENVDLYQVFLDSETSRDILKFYRPSRLKFGVKITNATLGNALSLLIELNWYLRRYVQEVLFEISPELYSTRAYASEIFKRNVKLQESWEYSKITGINGSVCGDTLFIAPHTSLEEYPLFTEKYELVLEIRCTQEEWEAAGEISIPEEYSVQDNILDNKQDDETASLDDDAENTDNLQQ